ncbi:50S ribosomal protein L24 [Candidatus Woesearchaeota archaeon]|nr:50S ribosomal protein L24 [Candidatus Woesearchaeota archaeon]
MKTVFSVGWNRSVQPRKQRKFRYNAPLHVRVRFVSAHLSPELRKRHGRRSLPLKSGDVVKVQAGSFKGKAGKVSSVDTKRVSAYIEGIESSRRDGTKVFVPVAVSSLMIVELNEEGGRRVLKNGRKTS